MRRILLFIFFITILASLFASTLPDGLEKTAKQLGFGERGHGYPAGLANCFLQFSSNHIVTVFFAGILGIVIIFSLYLGTIRLLKKN